MILLLGGCPIPIDLAFILDSSGSIGRKNWVKVKAFVKGIIDFYDVSERGTHVGKNTAGYIYLDNVDDNGGI